MKINYTKILSMCLFLVMAMSANAENRKWDFTNWSEETKTNLAAEAATVAEPWPATTLWRSYEKVGGPTEADPDRGGAAFWYGTELSEAAELTANGVAIAETKGLLFGNTMTAGSLAIAIDYQTTGLGTYDGPSYLWIGGKNNSFVIPNVKPGATITMYVESHKPTDGRGVSISIDGAKVEIGEGSEKPMEKTKCVWTIPSDLISPTVDVKVTNNSGCHIYSIDVDEDIYAPVKMTYVDYDNADTSFGLIAEGETAMAGFNKISGGKVEFANTGWGANKIAYLQVDASAAIGTITNVTLTAEFSGSTDNKRTTGWGVGYNSSEWSEALTYNTADRSITTMGDVQWTSEKPSTTFKELSFDITESIMNSESKVATILIYETAAAGGYIKNPKVLLTCTTAPTVEYTIKYALADGTELKTARTETGFVSGNPTLSAEDKADFYNDESKTAKYIYVSDDASTATIAADGSTVVTVTFREAGIYSYTINAVDAENNVLKENVAGGKGFEGDNVNAAYPYIINIEGTLWTSKKLSSDGKGFYLTTTLTEDGIVKTVVFTESEIKDVVYFSEAEDIEGLTLTSNNNTKIRSSNGASAYAADNDVVFTQLPCAKYVLTTVICDATKNAGSQWQFKAGEDVIFDFTAGNVNWAEGSSDEFTLNNESTDISLVKGGSKDQGVDFIYIRKTGNVTGINGVTDSTQADSNSVINLSGMTVRKAGESVKGLAKGLYITGGKKIIIK